AKPEHLTRERDCSLSEDGSYFKMKLEGGLEKMISEEFAAKSYGAVEQIIRALNNTLKPSDLHELTSEGHEYYAQVSE
ncbi:MAG: hypothetical protein ABSA47_14610, partial [Verrucomicrobiota bacterium]